MQPQEQSIESDAYYSSIPNTTGSPLRRTRRGNIVQQHLPSLYEKHDDVEDQDDTNNDDVFVSISTSSSNDDDDDDIKKKLRRKTLTKQSTHPKWTIPFLNQHSIRPTDIVSMMKSSFHKIPSQYKFICFIIWLLWKLGTVVFVLYMIYTTSDSNSTERDLLLRRQQDGNQHSQIPPLLRVLYTVTSFHEYDTERQGNRNTIQKEGSDRLMGLVLPVLNNSIHSLVNSNTNNGQQLPIIQVDVYLILAYPLLPHREALIRNTLLPGIVGIEIWDDAGPLGYTTNSTVLMENTNALARQHRYVIKDKLPYYDLFLSVEDDMRITDTQILHYLEMSNEINRRRRQEQNVTIQHNPKYNAADPKMIKLNEESALFFGPLTENQWNHLVPGFIRVEVLVNESQYTAQSIVDPIPILYPRKQKQGENDEELEEIHFDPKPCCHHLHQLSSRYINNNESIVPLTPKKDDIVVWETNITVLSVRQLPTFSENNTSIDSEYDWVVLLPGPDSSTERSFDNVVSDHRISGYWSGRDGAFGTNATEPNNTGESSHIIANQGGWMATQEQIMRFHNIINMNTTTNNWSNGTASTTNTTPPKQQQKALCQGSFLPPFDKPIYTSDGQESSKTVEL